MEGIAGLEEKQSLQNQTTQSGSVIPDEVTWWYVFSFDEVDVPLYQKIAMRVLYMFEKKILDRMPTHVFCFAKAGPGLIFIEPINGQVVVSYKYDDEGGEFHEVDAVSLLSQGGCICAPSTHRPSRGVLSFVPNCVNVVKVATNLSSIAMTPNSLYNSLMSRYYNTASGR